MAARSVIAGAAGVALLTAGLAVAQTAQPTPEQMKAMIAAAKEGAPTYAAVCESCHGPPNPGAPPRTVLVTMTAEHVYASLTTGKMKFAGDTITDSQKRAVAIYLTGKPLTAAPPEAAPATPPPETPPVQAPPVQ